MRVMAFSLLSLWAAVCQASTNMLSDICESVAKVYGSSSYFDAETLFMGVRGGDGLVGNADTERPFLELVPVVSNSCSDIERDWDSYRTNEVVRFTVLNAVAFSGIVAYTNFTAAMVARCERTNDTNDWKSVRFLFAPYRTPQELTMTLMCEDASVRGLLERIRECAARRGDSNVVERCEERLSGEAKREYLELKAAGAIE